MVDTDLGLGLFRRCNICRTYVYQAAIGGGTTCPCEQLTPTSPTEIKREENVGNLGIVFDKEMSFKFLKTLQSI